MQKPSPLTFSMEPFAPSFIWCRRPCGRSFVTPARFHSSMAMQMFAVWWVKLRRR